MFDEATPLAGQSNARNNPPQGAPQGAAQPFALDTDEGIPSISSVDREAPAREIPPAQKSPLERPSEQRTYAAGDIYTMPDKFAGPPGGRGKGLSGRRMLLIIGAAVVALAVVTGGVYAYFNWPIGAGRQVQPPSPRAVTTNTAPPVTNATPSATPGDGKERERDSQRVADVLAIAAALDLYVKQAGLYPQFLAALPTEILPSVPTDPLTSQAYTYEPRENKTSYVIVFDIESGAELRGLALDAGSWEVSPERVAKAGAGDATATSTPPIAGPLDADGDGLTAAEEALFTTSPNSDDTDADGYKDNIEISNFYSPVATGPTKLDAAGLVSLYTNTVYQYRFFYPTRWVVSVVTDDPGEVLVTSTTGEDFSVRVVDNPEGKTSWEWYVENVSQDYNQGNIDLITVDGRESVRTKDGLSVYSAAGTNVYVILYHVNNVGTVNYPNLFRFFLNRFILTE